jgi:hypothetical protein
MSQETTPQDDVTAARRITLLVVAWLWVAAPFAYGVYELINTAKKLFAK